MNKFLSIFKDFPEDFVFTDYEWDYKELIGQGGFGKIYKVKNKQTNQFDAIKKLDMKLFNEDFKLEALKSQIKIMQDIKSENVVQIKDSYIGKNYTYIILELCDSDLKKQLINNGGKLPEKQCAQIFHQISKGFAKMNKKQYIHRDIKPQNILIKKNTYKVGDFGFTKKINMKKQQKIQQVCGTPLYMAPQLLFNEKYSEKCDIWSLGLMLYQMLFGFGPWPNKHHEVYKNSILTKPIAFPYNASIGKNTYDFIKKCLQVEENSRMSWKQFLDHPFIKQKYCGEPVIFPKIDQKFQRALKSVQQNVRRRQINIIQCFKNYSQKFKNKNLQKKQFMSFLKKMDSTITTYEAESLFLLTDTDNDKSITLEQFYEIFCNVDYRPAEDISSRRIQSIIAMAQARNIRLKELFHLFDKDNSNTIDKQEFEQLIRKIAPKMNDLQINQMWERFDADNSGTIEADEFIAQMTRNTPNQGSKMDPDYERAKRNVICLGDYLKSNKISLKQFFRQTDINNDNKLSLEQFGNMIKSINYQISKEQIVQMFKVLDLNGNNFLELKQMEQRMRPLFNSH